MGSPSITVGSNEIDSPDTTFRIVSYVPLCYSYDHVQQCLRELFRLEEVAAMASTNDLTSDVHVGGVDSWSAGKVRDKGDGVVPILLVHYPGKVIQLHDGERLQRWWCSQVNRRVQGR